MSGTVVEVSDPPPSRTTIDIEPATDHVRDVPGWCVLDVAGTRVPTRVILGVAAWTSHRCRWCRALRACGGVRASST